MKKVFHEDFMKFAVNHIAKEETERTGVEVIPESVFCVWSCKTLQNSKGIFSTAIKGAPLYEITLNGDECAAYVDKYSKIQHSEYCMA